MERTAHVPTQQELAEARRTWGYRVPEHDHHPTGRLSISVPPRGIRGTLQGRRRRWADRGRWRLDDKLGHALAEIAQRAAIDERAAAEAGRRRAAQFGRLDLAWERLATERRAASLREQVEALRFADGIRTFCAELRSAPAVGARGGDLRRWLAWAEGYADEIDPRLHPPVAPDDPPPDYEAMTPYLGGDWSVYERRERWREWRVESEIGRRFPDPDDIYDER